MKIPGLLLILILIPLITYPAEEHEGRDQGNHILIADSLNHLAKVYMDTDTAFAKSCSYQALELSTRLQYLNGQVEALAFLATSYQSHGDYLKAIDLYFKIIDLYKERQDIGNLILFYSRIILVFNKIKDYDLAEKYLVIMTKLIQKSDDPEIIGQVHLNWAKHHFIKKENDVALRYAYLSWLYFHKANLPVLECQVHKFLGDVYIQKKMFAMADYNYRIAISLLNQNPDPAELAVLFTRLAHIYQVLDDHRLNLEYNLKAMRIREKTGPALFISYSYLNVGEAYWVIGRKDSANLYLQKSLQIATRINKTDLLETIYRQLSKFAEAENNYADALKYYIARMEYLGKLNQEANSSDILVLEATRSIREIDARNEILSQEILFQSLQIKNRRVQIFLFELLFIILLSLILIVDAIARKNRKRKNELKELNARLIQEINTRIEAEGRLNRSKELLRVLAENIVDVISLMDVNFKRLYISPSCEKFYGYEINEIMQMPNLLDLVEPTYHLAVNQHLMGMLRLKKPTRYTYKVIRKDRSVFWAEANINPILDPVTHEIRNIITVVRDISAQMKHEEELSENSRQKDYLLREIHNRVKNNFAILISLMNMQRSESADSTLSTSLSDLQLRVRTMSLVHEQLYQTKEITSIPFDKYLHHLVLIISNSFNNNRIQIHTEIMPCMLSIEMALPLGLILNELITNAFKYAFPGNRTGNIQVRLHPEGDGKFCISISDDGIGLPQDFRMGSIQTMGSQIIGILLEQIEAHLEISTENGACFRILFSTIQDT